MSKKLYEEALADVKKLKEVAEDNAKRAVLEAVTPRIKDFIENQLMGEHFGGFDEEPVEDDNLLMDEEVPGEFPEITAPDSDELESSPIDISGEIGDSDVCADAISMPDEEGKVTLDLDALTAGGSEYELSMESAEKLGLLEDPSRVFEAKLKKIEHSTKLMISASRMLKETNAYSTRLSSIISEVEDMYAYLQEKMKDSQKKIYEPLLERNYTSLKKLTEQKMKKNKINESDVTLKLTGLPDEVDLDSIGVDLITGDEEGDEDLAPDGDGDSDDLDMGDEDSEGGAEGSDDLDLDMGDEDSEDDTQMESRKLSDDTIVEIDSRMLRHELSKIKSLRESDEGTKPQSWGHGPGDVSDDFADEDNGDPFVDVKLRENDEDEDEDDLEEGQEDGTLTMDEDDDLENTEDSESAMANPGATVEGIKRRLSREVALQTEARKKATQAKKRQAEAQKKAKSAKKMSERQAARKHANKMHEAYVHFANVYNASVTRTNKFKGMLSEASRKGSTSNGASKRSAGESANLRTKLAETNLFNAKLIFTNKLLQNESLTRRQKASVIERLDEARTEREVKLVYESLVTALKGTATKKLNESTSRGVIGSASSPTRSSTSSQNLNEGIEADRWARLAGIVK
jgi:hypothetical protein